MRICIVGAGVSGIAAVKACLDEGLEPMAFERSNDLGGLWRYTDLVDGKACVMRTTMMNTSKEMSAFSDFPPPAEYSNFLHNSRVRKTSSDPDKWLVAFRPAAGVGNEPGEEQCETFDAVWVCTGHHAIPNLPAYPGADSFPGEVLHSHSCRDPLSEKFLDKTVLVIGAGNSAGDAVVELSHRARVVYWSTRRGTWVSNRVVDHGWPKDLVLARRYQMWLIRLIGLRYFRRQLEKSLQSRLDHDLYGLRPAHSPLQQHTFVNDELPNRLAAGLVKVRPDVARIDNRCVTFVDGSNVDGVDFSVSGNETRFYKHVFHPSVPSGSLAFIGFVQPLGATIPIAEAQSRWAARVAKGSCQLPPAQDMIEDAQQRRRTVAARFVISARHTIQVDWIPYMDELAAEIGCRPPLLRLLLTDPALFRAVVFEPCTPYQFRLVGPGAWPGARAAILGQMDRIRLGMRGGLSGGFCSEAQHGSDGFLSNSSLVVTAAVATAAVAASLWLLKRTGAFSNLIDYHI
uniref:Flavin-containing monooxygenase n=1 Tax=Macrostomum lignano TaxID=282301 RepID=A0A1I8G0P9_9PLAT